MDLSFFDWIKMALGWMIWMLKNYDILMAIGGVIGIVSMFNGSSAFHGGELAGRIVAILIGVGIRVWRIWRRNVQ